jgi:hypothetical protein
MGVGHWKTEQFVENEDLLTAELFIKALEISWSIHHDDLTNTSSEYILTLVEYIKMLMSK